MNKENMKPYIKYSGSIVFLDYWLSKVISNRQKI